MVEQQLDALARGQLALGVLRRNALLPAAEAGAGAAAVQPGEHLFHGGLRVGSCKRRGAGPITRAPSPVMAGLVPTMTAVGSLMAPISRRERVGNGGRVRRSDGAPFQPRAAAIIRAAASKSRHRAARRAWPLRPRPIARSGNPRRHGRCARPLRRRGAPRATASASRTEPVRLVMTCSAASANGLSTDRARRAPPAAAPSGWRTCTTPCATRSFAPSASPAQSSTGSNAAASAATSASGAVGAVAQQVGLGVAGDLGAGRVQRRRDAVERGIGEARQRHGRGIDRLALPRPFRGDRVRRARGSAGPAASWPGVRARRPSSSSAKPPPSASPTLAVLKKRLIAAGRILACAARIGSLGGASLIGRVLDRIALRDVEAEHVEALLHVLAAAAR